MEERYIKAIDPYKWVRPAGWLTMPTITSSDNKLAFLFAVYENRENCFSISYGSGTINATLDWGDGTSTTLNTTAIREKRYSYSSVSSVVLQDASGVNYKQVVITVTYNSGTFAAWTILAQSITIGAAGNRTGAPQILEAIISWPHNVLFSSRPGYNLFQSLIIKKLNYTGAVSSYLANLTNLRNLEGFENVTITSAGSNTSFMAYLGPIYQTININWSVGTSAATTFMQNGLFRKLGTVTVTSTGNGGLSSAFAGCNLLEEVGAINVTGNKILTSMFNLCTNLRKIGTITCNDVTTITGMFTSCFALEEVVFTNLSTVTSANATTFSNCISLRRCVLPGLTLAMSVSGCNLGRDAILELCNSLGTAATSQALTLTGNPGLLTTTAAEINAILGPKNWTYIA